MGFLVLLGCTVSWVKLVRVPLHVDSARVVVDQGKGYLAMVDAGPWFVTRYLLSNDALLTEDGRPLAPCPQGYGPIRESGGGLFYLHEGRGLYFSSSDNTDPRTNGRGYVLRIPFAMPIPLFLLGALLVLLWREPASRVVRRLTLRHPWRDGASPLREGPLSQLDGLRGWAILMIFNVHFFAMYAEAGYHLDAFPPLQELAKVMHAGMVGVTVFLQLSGFLIYYVISRKGYTVLSFLRRRFLRIMGLAFLFNAYASAPAGPGAFFDNVTFLNLFGSRLVNGPTWPIVYIVYFYILAAVWFIALRKVRAAQSWVALGAVAAAMVLVYWNGPRFPPIAQMYRMADFLFGAALAKVYLDDGLRAKAERLARHLFVPGVALFFLLRWLWAGHAGVIVGSRAYEMLYFTSVDVAVCLFLAPVIFCRGWWTRLFRLRALRFVGLISYSMLFVHVPIGLALARMVPVDGPRTMAAAYAVGLGVSVAVSAIVYTVFEHSGWPRFTRRDPAGPRLRECMPPRDAVPGVARSG